MGCCGEKINKLSTMDFYVELFNLEPEIAGEQNLKLKN